ncbi:MAG: response regulator transcription factor [Siculibacillus sp.]
MKKRIYLIEDDPDICDVVRALMEGYGYTFAAFQTGRDARLAIRREPPDLVLVDLILPDMNGLELVRELWSDVRFGLIVLTGRAEVSDRVLGLELGADDYIVKPFEPRELVARVNAVLRRHDQLVSATRNADQSRARFGPWTFDVGNLTLTNDDGHRENLTAAEANLLLMFVRAPNRVLSREQLQADQDDGDDFPYERSIDVRISRLRKKIEIDPRRPQLIKTVYGAGYLLAKDVVWSVSR